MSLDQKEIDIAAPVPIAAFQPESKELSYSPRPYFSARENLLAEIAFHLGNLSRTLAGNVPVKLKHPGLYCGSSVADITVAGPGTEMRIAQHTCTLCKRIIKTAAWGHEHTFESREEWIARQHGIRLQCQPCFNDWRANVKAFQEQEDSAQEARKKSPVSRAP